MRELNDVLAVRAVGVNCVPPTIVSGVLEELARLSCGKDFIVYPNSGERWDSREGERRWVGERAASLPDLAPTWRDLGAKLIGGCCRVLPDEIREIRRRLHAPPPSTPPGPSSGRAVGVSGTRALSTSSAAASTAVAPGTALAEARAALRTTGFARVPLGSAATLREMEEFAAEAMGVTTSGAYNGGGGVTRQTLGDSNFLDAAEGAPAKLPVQMHNEMACMHAAVLQPVSPGHR